MNWEQALRQRLIDAATPADDRWHWDVRPQGAPMPCGVLQTISDPRPQHLKGFTGRRQSRVQIRCLAEDKAAAVALREAAIAAVTGAGMFHGVTFGRAMIDGGGGGGEPGVASIFANERFDVLVMHD